MKLNDFLQLMFKMSFNTVKQTNGSSYYGMHKPLRTMSASELYRELFVLMPKIYCVDGFNISIQGHHGNYCETECGYRAWGENFSRLEWGFPSENIDWEKYNGEQEDTTSTVGTCSIELLEELLAEHGGIDWTQTAKNFNVIENEY